MSVDIVQHAALVVCLLVSIVLLSACGVTAAANSLGMVTQLHPRIVFTAQPDPATIEGYRSHPLYGVIHSRVRSTWATDPLSVAGSRQLRDIAFAYRVSGEQWLAERGATAIERAAKRLLAGQYEEKSDDQNHSIVLTNLAWAYDWLYDVLAPELRRDAAAALMALVDYGISNFGFNHKEGSFCAFNNHAAQAIAARALAGLAAAGEHPDALAHAQWAYRQFTEVFFPVMRFVAGDSGIWNEGTHYNTVMLKPLFHFMDAVRSATGEDLYSGEGWVRSTNYYWLYLTQPDGSVVMLGDWFYKKSTPSLYENLYSRIFPTIAKGAQETGDPFLQGYARAIMPRVISNQVEPWHIVWFSPDLPERPVADLPPSRLFRGDAEHGGEELAVLRSGWDDSARVITLTGGDWLGHHDHLNTAAFTAFYRADLAIDPGYDGESMLDWQFFRRSIAHNTIVIDTPEAAGQLANHAWGFDGGQRVSIQDDRPRNMDQFFRKRNPDYPSESLFETGTIVASQLSPGFDYVVVDATKAYARAQLTSFLRHLIFLKPDVVLVYDVIHSPEARQPRWLLQSVHPPQVGSATVLVQNGEGRLHAQVLLPSAPGIAAVATPAGYRTEVSGSPGSEHRFLVLMHLTDRDIETHPVASVTRQGDRLVVTLTGGTSLASQNDLRVLLPWDRTPGTQVEELE